MSLPAALAAIRDEAMLITCESWAIQKNWKLSRGIDRAGPCPKCGDDGKKSADRFSIHTKKNTFNCRRCGLSGSGVIDLVMKLEEVEFVRACEIVTGRAASVPIAPERAAEIAEQSAAAEKRRNDDENRRREAAVDAGRKIFVAATPLSPDGTGVGWDYLRLRGIDAAKIAAAGVPLDRIKLREHCALSYFDDGAGYHSVLMAGPALIGAVQRPDNIFSAVHQTWIDLFQEKGKLILPPKPDGKDRPSKKVRGSKKGGAVRLYTPPNPSRMVMGEGIETTLTALAHNFEADTAYWAGVDLGNMSGRAARDEAGKIVHDQPDMDDLECFIPPDWVRELVFLCDSDEPANRTVEKIMRGLKRAATLRPDLECALVEPVGNGKDLNDLVMVKR